MLTGSEPAEAATALFSILFPKVSFSSISFAGRATLSLVFSHWAPEAPIPLLYFPYVAVPSVQFGSFTRSGQLSTLFFCKISLLKLFWSAPDSDDFGLPFTFCVCLFSVLTFCCTSAVLGCLLNYLSSVFLGRSGHFSAWAFQETYFVFIFPFSFHRPHFIDTHLFNCHYRTHQQRINRDQILATFSYLLYLTS